jgi:hypothetical protein
MFGKIREMRKFSESGVAIVSEAGLPDGMCIYIPKNPKLYVFWRPLEWKKLVYFTTIRNIL